MRSTLLLLSVGMAACGGENVIDKQENKAPTILIMSHSDGASAQEGYTESFRATVSDDDNEFDELSVAWYVGEDLVCDWEVASMAGESFCDLVFSESLQSHWWTQRRPNHKRTPLPWKPLPNHKQGLHRRTKQHSAHQTHCHHRRL